MLGSNDSYPSSGSAPNEPAFMTREYSRQDLAILNELNDPCWVLTLDPQDTRNIWCNQAACRDFCNTLEEFQNIDLAAEREGSVEALWDDWYEAVQVQTRSLSFRQTFFPGKDSPMTMDCHLRPMRLISEDGVSSTVVLAAGKKVDVNDEWLNAAMRSREMLNHEKHCMTMLFARDGMEILSNHTAQKYYKGDMNGHAFDDPLELKDVFDSCVWRSHEERDTIYDRMLSLCIPGRTDSEYVVEVEKKHDKTEEVDERWHMLRFSSSKDPVTGHPAIMVVETDVSDQKKQMRLQEHFFATLCHELRTPLTGIIGLSDSILSDSSCPPSMHKIVNVIKNGGKRLAVLVCDIMDSASLKEQRLVVKHESVCIQDVVSNVCQMLGTILKKGVQLIADVEDTLPRIVGDTSRIEQILTNLVGNSAKFTSSGFIMISARRYGAGHIAIEVSDTGIGIPEDKICTIFGRFQQVDLATTRKYGGTGLGLSLVKNLVQAHNGKISVTSRMGDEDHGSKFTVILPIDGTAAPLDFPSEPEIHGHGGYAIATQSNGTLEELRLERDDLHHKLRDQQHKIDQLEAMLMQQHGHGDNSPGGAVVNHGASHETRRAHFIGHEQRQEPRIHDENGWVAQVAGGPTEENHAHQHRSQSQMLQAMGASTQSLLDDEDMPIQSYSDIHENVFEVLSVDDDPVNQMVIEGLLAPRGYVVTPCMDGEAALELLEERGYLPDVVLLDCQMPGKTGFEVCIELRRYYPETLPVIMISANTEEENILKGFQVGSNDYVKKPFNGAEVLARIQTQLRLRDTWKAEVDATRSQELLNKMLPPHIMTKLKSGDCNMIAEEHENVTILFSDIVSFTTIAASYSTKEIIEMLNEMFTAFDLLTMRHGVYKVQTIGDAYMIAAGHDEETREDHHKRVFSFAKDMLEVIRKVMLPDQETSLRIRIGIHSGPAYAGIVGVKCPRYCFFGDTVNTASRMESNGFPMCIHVSKDTMKLLENDCEWLSCGERMIKGKGMMATYLAQLGEWEEAWEKHQQKLEDESAGAIQEGAGNGLELVQRDQDLARREEALHQKQKMLETEQAKQRREMDEQMQRLDAKSHDYVKMKRKEEELALEIRDLQGRKHRLESEIHVAMKQHQAGSGVSSPGAFTPGSRGEGSGREEGFTRRLRSEETTSCGVPVEQAEAMQTAKLSLENAHSQIQRLKDDKAALQDEIQRLQGQVEVMGQQREAERRGSRGPRGSMNHSPGPLLVESPLSGGKHFDPNSPNSVNSGRWQRGSEVSELQRWMVEVLSCAEWCWGSGPSCAVMDGEVSMFLRHLGLQHYAHTLTTEEVYTLSVLADMDDDTLERLGIRTKASRLRILEGARCIKHVVELARTPEAPARPQSRSMSMEGSPSAYRRGSMTRSREPYDALPERPTSNGHVW